VLALLILLVVVGSTIWVGVDASKREFGDKGLVGSTAGWVVGCVLLWIVVFPYYLFRRGRAPLKSAAAAPLGLPSAGAIYRECPHCKESMRRDAKICPHCRQPSTPWRFHEGRWWFRASGEDSWRWLDERSGTWVTHEPAAPAPPP
jgi:hypothetical protein